MTEMGVEIIAKCFLSKQSMEHKKLQKLCYYAQAWHCALEGKTLFSETIEHGFTAQLYQFYIRNINLTAGKKFRKFILMILKYQKTL